MHYSHFEYESFIFRLPITQALLRSALEHKTNEHKALLEHEREHESWNEHVKVSRTHFCYCLENYLMFRYDKNNRQHITNNKATKLKISIYTLCSKFQIKQKEVQTEGIKDLGLFCKFLKICLTRKATQVRNFFPYIVRRDYFSPLYR